MRSSLVTALTAVIVFDALAWSLGILPALRYAFVYVSFQCSWASDPSADRLKPWALTRSLLRAS